MMLSKKQIIKFRFYANLTNNFLNSTQHTKKMQIKTVLIFSLLFIASINSAQAQRNDELPTHRNEISFTPFTMSRVKRIAWFTSDFSYRRITPSGAWLGGFGWVSDPFTPTVFSYTGSPRSMQFAALLHAGYEFRLGNPKKVHGTVSLELAGMHYQSFYSNNYGYMPNPITSTVYAHGTGLGLRSTLALQYIIAERVVIRAYGMFAYAALFDGKTDNYNQAGKALDSNPMPSQWLAEYPSLSVGVRF